jgi:hypothetical protein
MDSLNKRITRRLAIDWTKQNGTAVLMGIFMIVTIVTFTLNSDEAETVETAIVVLNFTTPDKHLPTDMSLLARLADGKTVQINLPPGWIPPMAGKQIRVKRITLLFFGERFVLLRQP